MAEADDLKCDGNKYIFTYIIEDLRFCAAKNGKYFSSPLFTVPQLLNTTWYLLIYPKGKKSESEGYVSCYLHRVSNETEPAEDVKVKCQFFVNTSEKTTLIFSFANNSRYGLGIPCLLKHDSESAWKYSVEIVCVMQLCDVKPNQYFSEMEALTYFSVSDTQSISHQTDLVEEILKPINDQIDGMKESIFALPYRCQARSRFHGENMEIVRPIEVELLSGTKLKQVIPVIHSNQTPLVMDLRISNEQRNHLEMELKLWSTATEVEELILVSGKVRLLSFKGELWNSSVEHLFDRADGYQAWVFPITFAMSDLWKEILKSPFNKVMLSIEFNISSADAMHSEIEWEGYGTNFFGYKSAVSLFNPVVFPHFRFLNDYKFYDVNLRVKDKIHSAHKSVLCASSPVFLAMFSSEMAESKTNTVDIEDLDEECVREMISYLYSGTIEELNWNKATKLYKAADKYQISSLLHICRAFFVENLTIENIFEVLRSPQLCNDFLLKNKCVEYVYWHRNSVLCNSEWKMFEGENNRLACEMLREICLFKRL